MSSEESKTVKKAGSATDHLANERTFLAWVRTSIALMGFGFVIVKFALFVQQVSLVMGEADTTFRTGYSSVIGVLMVGFGAVMGVLAFLRYRSIEKKLNAGLFFPSKKLAVLLTLAIVIGSILLLIYLLPNI
jgi:putative membrane protein